MYDVPGFHSILHFLGKPALVRQNEINNLKLLLQENVEFEKQECQEFKKGEKIEVIRGPLQGIIATSINEGRTHKLIVEIEKYGATLHRSCAKVMYSKNLIFDAWLFIYFLRNHKKYKCDLRMAKPYKLCLC